MDYNEIRRRTKEISVGNIAVGGNAPVSVQSMTNTDSSDFDATYAQMKALCGVGCDIVRMTVPDENAVRTLARLKESDIDIPIVADIHFDYKLAIASADAGADKIRINPGNIGDDDRIKAVADKCRQKNIPIRLGINSGSLDKRHIGVTEAGTDRTGTLKSAVGIGSLLMSGIGDTLRVSLTADPVLEVIRGREILHALGMDEKRKIYLVSCPTCGRTKVDLIRLVNDFEKRTDTLAPSRPIKVAIMGCAVNGPGEASDADIGIAGGNGEFLLFKEGKTVCKLAENSAIDRLVEEINKL